MFKSKYILFIFLFSFLNLNSMDDFSGKREIPENFFVINWKKFDKDLIPPLFDKFKETVNYNDDIKKNKPKLAEKIKFVYEKLIQDFENYINNKGLDYNKVYLYNELLLQLQAFINVLKTNSEKHQLETRFFERDIELKIKYFDYKRPSVGEDSYNLMIKIKELYIDYGLLKKV